MSKQNSIQFSNKMRHEISQFTAQNISPIARVAPSERNCIELRNKPNANHTALSEIRRSFTRPIMVKWFAPVRIFLLHQSIISFFSSLFFILNYVPIYLYMCGNSHGPCASRFIQLCWSKSICISWKKRIFSPSICFDATLHINPWNTMASCLPVKVRKPEIDFIRSNLHTNTT